MESEALDATTARLASKTAVPTPMCHTFLPNGTATAVDRRAAAVRDGAALVGTGVGIRRRETALARV
jgi:hypothetical protein